MTMIELRRRIAFHRACERALLCLAEGDAFPLMWERRAAPHASQARCYEAMLIQRFNNPLRVTI